MKEKSKILIVDDKPENLIALQKTLEDDIELEIITATSGDEALKTILHHQFAMFILDVMMPVMDGYELAELIRSQKETKNIPLIFLTAMDQTDRSLFKGYQLGAVDYLFKPIDAIILQSKVKIFVELDQQKKELQLNNKELKNEIARRKITEVKLEKAKIDAVSANRAKSIFLANMSHEIRTPMNAILGYAQLLMRDKRLEADQKKGVNTISKSANNLLDLINDILDISRIETGRMELNTVDFDLSDLITGVKSLFQMVCEDKNLYLKIEGINSPIHVHGDEGKIRQIFINLVGNAVKYTDTGGIYIKLNEIKNHEYRLTVRDTGNGIPIEEQTKIFQAFNQGSEGNENGGTGLGLAICKKHVELMKGELSVKSEPGNGATFFLTLNFPPSKGKIIPRKNRNLEIVRLKEGQNIKALVADDVEENRSVLSKFLTNVGMKVVEAKNGKEAVESFRQNKPDIIYMDIQMPTMNGLEAIRQLKKEFPENKLNIVIMSASVLKHEREKYKELGCSEIIQKPFRMDKIYSSAQNLIGVEYEYEQREPSPKKQFIPIEINYSKIQFPKNMISKLEQAANICNLTDIDEILNGLEANNNNEIGVLKKLTDYRNNYDSEGMLKIINNLKSADKT